MYKQEHESSMFIQLDGKAWRKGDETRDLPMFHDINHGLVTVDKDNYMELSNYLQESPDNQD